MDTTKRTIDESKGWAISYWDWDTGLPRIAGRFKTTKEKDDFLEEISKLGSGWLQEEIGSITEHNDYWYMLPY